VLRLFGHVPETGKSVQNRHEERQFMAVFGQKRNGFWSRGRLRFLFQQSVKYGPAMRIGAGGFHADIRQHLGNLGNDLTQIMRELLNDPLDDLAHIENRVKALTAKVDVIANEEGAIRRLLTIPGSAL
jgi:hypothetical protein